MAIANYISSFGLIITVALSTFVATAEEPPKPSRHSTIYDGIWWENTNPDERLGFLYAMDDCFTFDSHPVYSFSGTWASYADRITTYYQGSKKHLSDPVSKVFVSLAEPNKPSSPEERYGNVFWRSHKNSARLGYVEGFLHCRAIYPWGQSWSLAPSEYVEKLNTLYNADDRLGENAKEFDGPISDAFKRIAASK